MLTSIIARTGRSKTDPRIDLRVNVSRSDLSGQPAELTFFCITMETGPARLMSKAGAEGKGVIFRGKMLGVLKKTQFYQVMKRTVEKSINTVKNHMYLNEIGRLGKVMVYWLNSSLHDRFA